MAYKFKTNDRIRLTADHSDALPFLMAGATGTVQKPFGFNQDKPEYFVRMDESRIGGVFDADDLDFWVIKEEDLEAAE